MANFMQNKVAAAIKKGWTRVLQEGKKLFELRPCPECKTQSPLLEKDVRVMLICSKCKKAHIRQRKEKVDNTLPPETPTNPIHAAVMGIRAGVKDLKSQCTGTTARGARCKRKVTPPATTCPIHGQNLGF